MEVFKKLGDETRANHTLNVLDYHTDRIESAEVARDAGVGRLVLTHIIPPPNVVIKRMFMGGMKDVFEGDIMLAEDGMRFYLAPHG